MKFIDIKHFTPFTTPEAIKVTLVGLTILPQMPRACSKLRAHAKNDA